MSMCLYVPMSSDSILNSKKSLSYTFCCFGYLGFVGIFANGFSSSSSNSSIFCSAGLTFMSNLTSSETKKFQNYQANQLKPSVSVVFPVLSFFKLFFSANESLFCAFLLAWKEESIDFRLCSTFTHTKHKTNESCTI